MAFCIVRGGWDRFGFGGKSQARNENASPEAREAARPAPAALLHGDVKREDATTRRREGRKETPDSKHVGYLPRRARSTRREYCQVRLGLRVLRVLRGKPWFENSLATAARPGATCPIRTANCDLRTAA